MQQVAYGKLRPMTQCYTSNPQTNPYAVEIQYRDRIPPETPVWISDDRQILGACWIVTRRASLDLPEQLWVTHREREGAITHAKLLGATYPDEQYRVYRHGPTTNWYDRSHCYQVGANDARLYELKHGEGARRPIPLGVGRVASVGLDVLGLGQTK